MIWKYFLPSFGYIAFWWIALFMWVIPWMQLGWISLSNIGLWQIIVILLFFTIGVLLGICAFAVILFSTENDKEEPKKEYANVVHSGSYH